MNDIDRLSIDIVDLESDVASLTDAIGQSPYYLVTIDNDKREYIGVWFCKAEVKEFINSCKLKSGLGFKKRSPLGKCKTYLIERFYVPEHIPIKPKFEG